MVWYLFSSWGYWYNTAQNRFEKRKEGERLKARWLFIPGVICIILGFIIPMILMMTYQPEGIEGIWGWLMIIVMFSTAASVYSWVGWVFIIAGIILIIASIALYIHNRGKGRKKGRRKK